MGESVCGACGVVAPAILTNAGSVLELGTRNRLARVVRETGVTAEGETAGPSLSFVMTAQI